MPRPRLTDEEQELWDKIKDNDFIKDQITVLSEECNKAGIPLEDVRHYWYKSKHISVFAKNKVKGYEEIREDVILQMQEHAPFYPNIERIPISNPHLLVLDPSDIHIGKLSVACETGYEYNIAKAVERTINGCKSLINKASGFNIDRILLIIGNDALHVDHPHRKTTSGTPQDTDGQWHEAFMAAKNMYVSIIELLIQVADVDVLYCPSNHDFMSGYFLADTLTSWFRNCKHVTFNASPIHRKYYKYGQNMIEADHGDGCKVRDTPLLMAHEAPEMWAECRFRYSYKHHVHHKRKVGALVEHGYDDIGVSIEFLRSPSPADGWHHRNGYVNTPAIEAFIHCKEGGRQAQLTEWFN